MPHLPSRGVMLFVTFPKQAGQTGQAQQTDPRVIRLVIAMGRGVSRPVISGTGRVSVGGLCKRGHGCDGKHCAESERTDGMMFLHRPIQRAVPVRCVPECRYQVSSPAPSGRNHASSARAASFSISSSSPELKGLSVLAVTGRGALGAVGVHAVTARRDCVARNRFPGIAESLQEFPTVSVWQTDVADEDFSFCHGKRLQRAFHRLRSDHGVTTSFEITSQRLQRVRVILDEKNSQGADGTHDKGRRTCIGIPTRMHEGCTANGPLHRPVTCEMSLNGTRGRGLGAIRRADEALRPQQNKVARRRNGE